MPRHTCRQQCKNTKGHVRVDQSQSKDGDGFLPETPNSLQNVNNIQFYKTNLLFYYFC